MDWIDTLKTLAPTVATALGGPLAGAAVSAIGAALGVPPGSIAKAFQDSQLTPESVAKLRELELQFQNDEKERGFRYEELVYKDKDSARVNNTAGGIQGRLFYLSLLLLIMTLGAEGAVLFVGYPPGIPEVVVGRILGLADSIALMVLSYYYGTSSGSAQKTELLAGK